jgi:hypothetical protein
MNGIIQLGWRFCTSEAGATISSRRVVIAVLALMGSCLAQQGLVIRISGKQAAPSDAEKVYVSACSQMEREFRLAQPLRPHVTLMLGARENGVVLDAREVHLTKWDAHMFAQGVVAIGFEDLRHREQRILATRAVTWAESIVDARSFAK